MKKSRSRDLFKYTCTVDEFEKRLQLIVRESYENGVDVTGNDRTLLISLYQEYRQDKMLAPISVRGELNSIGNGVHAVFVLQDGSADIVSLPKARWQIDKQCPAAIGKRRLQEALRFTVRPQSNEVRFRARMAITNHAPEICPLSGISLEKHDEIDVHHSGAGREFVQLVESWVKSEGLRGRDVKVASAPNGEGSIMADVNQRQSWYNFHASHAQLVAVDKDAHSKLPKSRLNLDW